MVLMDNPELIASLEALAMRTWPALETRYYDGWIMRFAEGATRRSNSVWPIFSSSIMLDQKISLCEQVYRSHSLPVVFRVTDAVVPGDLDDVLAARSYRKEALTQVMAMPLAQRPVEQRPFTARSDVLTPAWSIAYAVLHKVSMSPEDQRTQLIAGILPSRQFVCIHNAAGEPIALGLAVCDGDWVVLYEVHVAESYRRQGYGLALMDALLEWGIMQGATRACLHVESSNTGDIQFYESMGFITSYDYWYRVQEKRD